MKKKSFSEKVANFISTVFKCSIPILNILNAITILCMGDKAYEYIEKKYLEEGKIYKPISNKLNNDCENKILTEEKMDYYEMTPEEMIARLEEQKQMFIKFQELCGNDRIGETLDEINEQTKAQESKPKTYSMGNNSNLKHR